MAYFWKVEESVGQCYIVHDGCYDTRAACQAAIDKLPSNSGCRAQLYQTGTWNGAVRIEENHNK